MTRVSSILLSQNGQLIGGAFMPITMSTHDTTIHSHQNTTGTIELTTSKRGKEKKEGENERKKGMGENTPKIKFWLQRCMKDTQSRSSVD